ncbi:MAG: hypothetical protein OSA97_15910, partial [Nevskia sp.]|nr:hypothetical protein [Nevskia sp.]
MTIPSSGGASDTTLMPIGREIATLSFPEEIGTLAWSPDQKLLAATNGWNTKVYLRGVDHDRELWQAPKMGTADERCLAFDKTGRYVIARSTIAVASENRETSVSLLRVDNGHVFRHLGDEMPAVGSNAAAHFALSADQSLLAVILGSSSGRVGLYNTSTWELTGHVGPLANPYGVRQVAVDPLRNLVVFGVGNGEIQTWRIATNERLATFKAYDVELDYMVTNPLTGDIVTGGNASIERRWIPDLKAPPSPRAQGHMETFHDDQPTLVRAWDPLSGARRVTYTGPGQGVSALTVSPDGRYVAAVKGGINLEAYLLMWDAGSGRLIGGIDYNHGTSNGGLAFSP